MLPLLLGLAMGLTSGRWGVATLSAGTGMVIGLLFHPWLYRHCQRRAMQKDLRSRTTQARLGSVELRLDAQGLILRNVVAESHLHWAAVRSIQASPAHVLLYISEETAVIVPHRAFASTDVMDEFLARARQWREKVLTPTPQ
jgi:hypothetical protein